MVRLVKHGVERGITFFDTADVYTAGESEGLLGEVLAGQRDRVTVATKVGFRARVPSRTPWPPGSTRKPRHRSGGTPSAPGW
jgi:aryl-alcohol dehydrogenase-like predicted oxidoreductase